MSYVLTTLSNTDTNLSVTNGTLTTPAVLNLDTSLVALDSIAGITGGPGASTVGALTNKSITVNNVAKGNFATTTNALTPTVLLTIPVPTNRSLVGNITILARDTTSFIGAFSTTTVGAVNTAGVVTTLGAALPTVTLVGYDVVTFPILAVWTIVGTNLVLTVTGVAVNTLNWGCSYEYFIA